MLNFYCSYFFKKLELIITIKGFKIGTVRVYNITNIIYELEVTTEFSGR